MTERRKFKPAPDTRKRQGLERGRGFSGRVSMARPEKLLEFQRRLKRDSGNAKGRLAAALKRGSPGIAPLL